MNTLAAFLTDLSDWQKAATALLGSLSFGIVLGVGGVAFTGLPERVEGHEAGMDSLRVAVKANTDAIRHQEDDFETLICLLTLPDSVSPIESRTLCEVPN